MIDGSCRRWSVTLPTHANAPCCPVSPVRRTAPTACSNQPNPYHHPQHHRSPQQGTGPTGTPTIVDFKDSQGRAPREATRQVAFRVPNSVQKCNPQHSSSLLPTWRGPAAATAHNARPKATTDSTHVHNRCVRTPPGKQRPQIRGNSGSGPSPTACRHVVIA